MSRPKAYSYIRFSSKRQEKGSSVERQTAATSAFAKRHNLDLQDVTYSDLGVSAFRGKHAKAGALKAFVDAVEDGKIEQGSWLLVESLDRISREKLGAAQRRLSELLELGITIATIADGNVYKPSSRDSLGDALQMMVVLSRSHEESLMKSQRSKGGWAKTRRVAKEGQAHPQSKGGILPMWLQKTNTGEVETIPERVALVQRVYKMALDGLGSVAIANRLNSEGLTSGTGKPWSAGSISKLLTRRFVLGEWQPHTTTITEDGKRKLIPDGEPLHIYPPIISEADWLRVQKMRKSRDSLTGRAAASELRNIFSGLGRCRCGAPMRYVQRSDKVPSIVCRSSEYGQPCPYRKQIQYRPLEKLTVLALMSVDFSALFPDNRTQRQEKLEALRSSLLVVDAQINKATNRREKAVETMLDNDDPLLRSALTSAVTGAEKALREASSERKELLSEVAALEAQLEESDSQSVSFSEIGKLMESEGGKEKVNQFLKSQLEAVTFDGKAESIEFKLKHSEETFQLLFSIKEKWFEVLKDGHSERWGSWK